MEAWRFGFKNEPSVNKFDPTDEDIVAYYLLPRATGVPNEYEHAIIDDDPCSCPPWELLRRHGHGDSDHAFFFVPPRDDMARVSRVVSPAAPGGVGGVWRGQKSVDKEVVIVRGHAGGAQLTIKFRRYNLTYYRTGEHSSSGWVMHEYHVVHPVLRRPGAVVARIKITERGKKRGNRQRLMQEEADVIARAAAATVVAAGPDHQPGPSNYFGVSESDYYGHAGAGNAAVVAGVDGEGTSSGGAHKSSVAVVQHGDDSYNGGGVCLDEMAGGYNFTDFLNAVVDGSINYIVGGEDPPVHGDFHDAGNAVALSDDGAGTSGHAQPGSQIVHQQGGVVGDTTNGYYVDDDGKIYLNVEDISHYLDQDLVGSTGDHFTIENKSIYEPTTNASDTPAATDNKEEKGS